MKVLKVKDVSKCYGKKQALDHFSLDVNQGDVLGLLGPNGSGKTTAINCILALLTYEQGSIEIFGKPMNVDSLDIKKDIGVVMQDIAVFEELTVFQNIDYFCNLYIKDKAKRKQLVEEAIRFVGLEDFKKQMPKKLSGGLLRRLNIACGIAHKPKLIFMDEPTVAVDPQSRNHILENIKELNKQGATIIYTTHYMEEVEQICNHIVIMDNGKELAKGTKEELKHSINVQEKIIVELQNITSQDLDALKELENVQYVAFDEGILNIEVSKNNDVLLSVLEYFKLKNIVYENVYTEKPTLNDVFLELTGKGLRD